MPAVRSLQELPEGLDLELVRPGRLVVAVKDSEDFLRFYRAASPRKAPAALRQCVRGQLCLSNEGKGSASIGCGEGLQLQVTMEGAASLTLSAGYVEVSLTARQ